MTTKVILDTDIGSDIDDTWALVFLLKCPELSLQLITTCTGDTIYRAKLVAKLLEVAKRIDIPIGIGLMDPIISTKYDKDKHRYQQIDWITSYNFNEYKGLVYQDGVQAIIDTIMKTPENEDIVLLSIGPCPNISAALKLKPEIAQRARFVGMHGSVFKGYRGKLRPSPEYNVASFAQDAYNVFTAPWRSITITPLDTCGIVILQGALYKKVFSSKDPLLKALIENFLSWFHKLNRDAAATGEGYEYYCENRSSTLYDTVAVFLLLPQHSNFLEMQNHPILVDVETGFTKIDKEFGKSISVAVNWKNIRAFEVFMVSRLTGTEENILAKNLET